MIHKQRTIRRSCHGAHKHKHTQTHGHKSSSGDENGDENGDEDGNGDGNEDGIGKGGREAQIPTPCDMLPINHSTQK